ncbi:MAG: tRNA (adenosine(37)-N6)-threonylcarbamoyltransferase complex ATPase subunit type 1 TsaE [Cyanobacteria bacterium K_Offshore_surface_m2_239]|nr:tRNA (adenosine(37)-N6)-threonylcarbamoyltransferase complex ATPase subunit type 1 TsaE [Cyanobacteria bacterium K_Offshore_surface_m2_239]
MGGNNAIEVCQLSDADATLDLGRRLAKRLLDQRLRERRPDQPWTGPPPLLLLQGDLGAGKTCLVQGLAQGLGILEPITSPTFALAHHYRGETTLSPPPRDLAPTRPAASPAADVDPSAVIRVPTALVHLDLYRLEQPAAAAELFAQEEEEARALGAVLAVEWPERLIVQPEPCWRVELREVGAGREARVRGLGSSPPRDLQPSSKQASP